MSTLYLQSMKNVIKRMKTETISQPQLSCRTLLEFSWK